MRIADFEMGADDVTNVARRFEFGLEIRGGDKLINRSRRLAALPNQFVQSVHLLGGSGRNWTGHKAIAEADNVCDDPGLEDSSDRLMSSELCEEFSLHADPATYQCELSCPRVHWGRIQCCSRIAAGHRQ
ncbi:hypothetical protein C6P86_04205 [Burkholderia multivorans]|nr:hypothetical protein C6P86_04205 [Burkholderia multivorans]PRE90107.1 hypothetical protein C6Q00_04515 [Burkholderia multivorans]PRG24282.1 hypothetical protein C6T57_10145 [Burkholderia multivorans]